MSIRVLKMENDYGNSIKFGIFKDLGDKRFILVGNEWRPYDFERLAKKEEELFSLSLRYPDTHEILQGLTNVIATMGILPDSVQTVKSEMAIVEEHLKDSRDVRDRLLSMLEVINKETK